jgi:hypothetical protein
MENKRIEITIITSRLLVASKVKSMTAWCADCRKQADWLSVEDTALLCQVPSRNLFQEAEEGKLHSLETSDGLLLLCLNSLQGEAEREKAKLQSQQAHQP